MIIFLLDLSTETNPYACKYTQQYQSMHSNHKALGIVV